MLQCNAIEYNRTTQYTVHYNKAIQSNAAQLKSDTYYLFPVQHTIEVCHESREVLQLRIHALTQLLLRKETIKNLLPV